MEDAVTWRSGLSPLYEEQEGMAQSTILLLPSGDEKQRCATLENDVTD